MAAGPASIKDPEAIPQHQLVEMTAADSRGLNNAALEFRNEAQLQVPTNVGKRNRRKSFLMSRRISTKKTRRVADDKDIEQDLSSVALPSDGDSLSPKLRSPVNQKDFPLPSPELCLLLGPSDGFARTRREEGGEPTTNNRNDLLDAGKCVGGVNMTSFPTSEKNEDDPVEFETRRNCWRMETFRITRLSLDDSAIDLHSGNERGGRIRKNRRGIEECGEEGAISQTRLLSPRTLNESGVLLREPAAERQFSDRVFDGQSGQLASVDQVESVQRWWWSQTSYPDAEIFPVQGQTELRIVRRRHCGRSVESSVLSCYAGRPGMSCH